LISELKPEMVTAGTLRQYPGLKNFSKELPQRGLVRAPDGRMRYSLKERVKTYQQIASWLGVQPSLCKETEQLWQELGWHFNGCNCTVPELRNDPISSRDNLGSPQLKLL
jgi:spore photoproduct lyase